MQNSNLARSAIVPTRAFRVITSPRHWGFDQKGIKLQVIEGLDTSNNVCTYVCMHVFAGKSFTHTHMRMCRLTFRRQQLAESRFQLEFIQSFSLPGRKGLGFTDLGAANFEGLRSEAVRTRSRRHQLLHLPGTNDSSWKVARKAPEMMTKEKTKLAWPERPVCMTLGPGLLAKAAA